MGREFSAEELRVFLLRKILFRYGFGKLGTSESPGKNSALTASKNESCGSLLRSVCDVWSIPLGALAGRAGVDQVVLSSYIMGMSGLTTQQTEAVLGALESMVNEMAGPS